MASQEQDDDHGENAQQRRNRRGEAPALEAASVLVVHLAHAPRMSLRRLALNECHEAVGELGIAIVQALDGVDGVESAGRQGHGLHVGGIGHGGD